MKRLALVLLSAVLISACTDPVGKNPQPGTNRCTFNPSTSGTATFYIPGTPSFLACGRSTLSPGVVGVVAVPTHLFANGAVCGSCIEIVGPTHTVIAQAVDHCPGCSASQLDLGQDVFEALGGVPSAGIINVSWRQVPCDGVAGMSFWFEASNDFFLKLRVEHTRTPLQSVALVKAGVEYPMTPTSDGAYQLTGSPALPDAGPYLIRVTDIFGASVDQGGVPQSATVASPFAGTAQFPKCEE